MKIYNTITKQKEEFKPIDENEIKIYVCGPTVYNYFHIGNARPFVIFDTLRRYFEYRGMNVNYVQNFTDVDDKIINKAKEEGVTPEEISNKYIDEYFRDAASLNVRKATAHPRVTENISEIIAFIELLMKKGYAYEADGDVYFDTGAFESYGTLSGQNTEDLMSGARIDINTNKKNPLDFVLWKKRKDIDEIAWESPWGDGRPGWHIECSVMSNKYLGETIDIHGGGQDLIFPHHENEMAQSVAATGKKIADYWMHNGYITIDNEKMSKSKGNFFTVRDILKEYDGEVIRFFLLSGHYRSPINFNRELIDQAKNALERMHNAKNTLEHLAKTGSGELTETEKETLRDLEKFRDKFIRVMDDDFNTADGISVIFELISGINNQIKHRVSKVFAIKCHNLLLELASVLGLLENERYNTIDDKEIADLIEERQKARADKDYSRADEIRDILKKRGITLKDTAQGVQIIKE